MLVEWIAPTICVENPEIPGTIQMERFIPVEMFRKKVIPFEVLPFSRSYWNDRNFLYHSFGLPVPEFMWRESGKCTGIFKSRSCFQWQKQKYENHLTEIFHRNFCTNGKRSIPRTLSLGFGKFPPKWTVLFEFSLEFITRYSIQMVSALSSVSYTWIFICS